MNDITPRIPYSVDSELCVSVMTLRNAPLGERIRAAADAGFRAIGWQLEDFTDERYVQGMSRQDISQMLSASAIVPEEIEFFREWIGRNGDIEYREQERQLFELADLLGAKRVNVAVFSPAPRQEIVEAMRALCLRAAPHELIVQLEPMAYTPPVTSLQLAWEIVREVDTPNAGLLIDAWQWAHEHESADSLRSIPPERITGIQLSDTLPLPAPDIVQESRHQRCIPGTGSMDLPGFLHILTEHGVQAPLSVEVMSDVLDALPPVDAARQVADGARNVLRQLR